MDMEIVNTAVIACPKPGHLQKPLAVTAPLFPVQDMSRRCRSAQRDCKCARDRSFKRDQYGCRLSWMYCSGS